MKKKINREAVGAWLVGLVVVSGLAAGLAGIIYSMSKDTIRPRDCKVLDSVTYCSEAVTENYLNYLSVLSWTLPLAVLAWTVGYVGYRLVEYR